MRRANQVAALLEAPLDQLWCLGCRFFAPSNEKPTRYRRGHHDRAVNLEAIVQHSTKLLGNILSPPRGFLSVLKALAVVVQIGQGQRVICAGMYEQQPLLAVPHWSC